MCIVSAGSVRCTCICEKIQNLGMGEKSKSIRNNVFFTVIQNNTLLKVIQTRHAQTRTDADGDVVRFIMDITDRFAGPISRHPCVIV